MPYKRTMHAAGERFGRLVIVTEDVERGSSRQVRWVVRCDCGTVTSALGTALRSGHVTSCGCWGRQTGARHGMHDSPEYHAWSELRARCHNPRHKSYPRYGGRGITVCPEWKSFDRFYADMGARPSPAHSIDRIDNDGPYSPYNCRWATRTEQARNRERSAYLTYDGVRMTLVEWAANLGVPFSTLKSRLEYGWPVERILSPSGRRLTVAERSEVEEALRRGAETHRVIAQRYGIDRSRVTAIAKELRHRSAHLEKNP